MWFQTVDWTVGCKLPVQHIYTEAELSPNVLIKSVSLPMVGRFNCSHALLVMYDLWLQQESNITWAFHPSCWLSGLQTKAWATCNNTQLALLLTCIAEVPASLILSRDHPDPRGVASSLTTFLAVGMFLILSQMVTWCLPSQLKHNLWRYGHPSGTQNTCRFVSVMVMQLMDL